MNHDELLGNIASNNFINSRTLKTPYAALRAILELHKPIKMKDDFIYCDGCSNSEFLPWDSCETIKAIQRELA